MIPLEPLKTGWSPERTRHPFTRKLRRKKPGCRLAPVKPKDQRAKEPEGASDGWYFSVKGLEPSFSKSACTVQEAASFGEEPWRVRLRKCSWTWVLFDLVTLANNGRPKSRGAPRGATRSKFISEELRFPLISKFSRLPVDGTIPVGSVESMLPLEYFPATLCSLGGGQEGAGWDAWLGLARTAELP